MPKDRFARKSLSKSVLEMKFMQRSKKRIQAEKEAAEGITANEKSITEDMKNSKDNIVSLASYVPCLDLIIGRVSFRGMNPEIEKLMANEKDSGENEDDSAMDQDITNWEMLKLTNVAQTVANKFTTKKSRNKALKRLKDDD